MKTLVRLAHTLGTAKKISATTLITIFINPGLPKFVCGAFMPVTVVLIDGMYTHGIKHVVINATAIAMPK